MTACKLFGLIVIVVMTATVLYIIIDWSANYNDHNGLYKCWRKKRQNECGIIVINIP